jgi:poly(3-hydroxyoctanoate) depolymerase
MHPSRVRGFEVLARRIAAILPASVQRSETLLFLPGASGDTEFWKPVASRLRYPGARRFMAWPGFGGVPSEPGVDGISDLVARIVREIDGPVGLLAQSMGAVIAVEAALEKPELVRHLVLSVSSGGIDTASLGAEDWRPAFVKEHPATPRWFVEERTDLSQRISEIAIPVLLLWGDADPISPVAVGRRLAQLIPRAELVVISGGTHDLIAEQAAAVAPLIDEYLAR